MSNNIDNAGKSFTTFTTEDGVLVYYFNIPSGFDESDDIEVIVNDVKLAESVDYIYEFISPITGYKLTFTQSQGVQDVRVQRVTNIVSPSIVFTNTTYTPSTLNKMISKLYNAMQELLDTGISKNDVEYINAVIKLASEAEAGIIPISTSNEALQGTVDNKAITPLKLKQVLDDLEYVLEQATEAVAGIAKIATDADMDNGVDDSKFITPLKLTTLLADQGGDIIPPATTTTPGTTVHLPTFDPEDTENETGSVTPKYLTSWKTSNEFVGSVLDAIPDASESEKGIAPIATSADALAGTDDTKIMTPAKVASLISNSPNSNISYGTSAPNDADGKPDGSIYIQYTP